MRLTNRLTVLAELNPDYIKIGCERISNASHQVRVNSGTRTDACGAVLSCAMPV